MNRETGVECVPLKKAPIRSIMRIQLIGDFLSVNGQHHQIVANRSYKVKKNVMSVKYQTEMD